MQTGNYRTASFDPSARILYLPVFKADAMTKDMIDLFIGHEVSHALYTPSDSIKEIQLKYAHIPFAFFNIVEDIRIERLIQKTYPGLAINFRNGYQELVNRNFFDLNGKNVSALSLPDRLNIHAKIGRFVEVNFNAEEQDFFNRCYAAETFEEVIKLTVELFDRINSGDFKDEKPEVKPTEAPEGDEPEGDEPEEDNAETMETSGSDDSDDESEDKKDSSVSTKAADKDGDEAKSAKGDDGEETKGKSDQDSTNEASETTGSSKTPTTGSTKLNEFDVSTTKALDEAFINNTEDVKVKIVTMPGREELNAALVSYKELAEIRKAYYDSDFFRGYNVETASEEPFKKFMVESKKYVSNLVNEFNRKKSASLYSRSTTAKVGTLDTNRMHSYKFSEDIFRTVSVTPEDTNHGMVMFMDMSASMSASIHDVVKQVIQLSLFCRQVGVKFDVYGFNTTSHSNEDKARNRNKINVLSKQGHSFYLRYEHLNLLHLISSEQSKIEFNEAIRAIFKYNTSHDNYQIPYIERLSGTPLVEAMVAANFIVSDFKKKHKVEKLNVIVLSDGDGGAPRIEYPSSVPDAKHFSKATFILNGRQVTPDSHGFKCWYEAVIVNLGITTGANVIGYYLIPSNRRYIQNKFPLLTKEKVKSISDAGSGNIGKHLGFSSYFVVTSDSMRYDDDEELGDFTVEGNIASRSNIKKMASVFGKLMESQKNSRVFLREFSSIIA